MSLYEVIVKMEKLRTACTKTTNRSLSKKKLTNVRGQNKGLITSLPSAKYKGGI
jgi:hypothetical protein